MSISAVCQRHTLTFTFYILSFINGDKLQFECNLEWNKNENLSLPKVVLQTAISQNTLRQLLLTAKH